MFSQRKGLVPAIKEIQLEGVDDELRNRLWNVFHDLYLKPYLGQFIRYTPINTLIIGYWHSFFKWRIDELNEDVSVIRIVLRDEFFDLPWFRLYDFIEFTLQNAPENIIDLFRKLCNSILEEENSGYRIIDDQVVQVTSQSELEAIDEAIANVSPFSGVKVHLTTALKLLSDRQNPDYRNSIKESISAVEAIAQVVTGNSKATLGEALAVLEGQMNMHGALKSSFSKLYGYTSDAQGIRHAMIDEPHLTFVDAKFMLVSCSAFVNYIIGKVAELGIQLPKKV